MSDMKEIPIDVNIGRVVQAISKIGYNPSAAIMDIIDNSVAANASKIIVNIFKDDEKRVAQKYSLKKVSIVDNGNGMDEPRILRALSLGSNIEYQKGSLSKYGMGLKSAGFSLGDTIRVISKRNEVLSKIYELSEPYIVENNKYSVNVIDMSEEEIDYYNNEINNDTGTVVEIINCSIVTKESIQKIKDELWEKLGVTYYQYILEDNLEIKIQEHLSEEVKEYNVEPFDILFKENSMNEYDPDNYDYKSPCKVFDERVRFSEDSDNVPIEVYVFPQDQMQRYIGFTPEEKDLIKKYKIGSKNSGFFIYRNGRLIKWGDDLSGEIGRDLKGFRGRILLNESHDDLFNVDVSKQRINISEEILKKISELMRLPKKTAADVFSSCTKAFNDASSIDEGQTFNENTKYFSSEDPDIVKLTPSMKERKKKIVEESKKIIEVENEELNKENEKKIDEIDCIENVQNNNDKPFEKVRYSSNVIGNVVLTAHDSPDEDVFIRINKNHYFYSSIMQKLNNKEDIKQIIEAIFWSLGVAEIQTLVSHTDVDEELLKNIIKKFQIKFGHNLSSWCSNNNNLLGD